MRGRVIAIVVAYVGIVLEGLIIQMGTKGTEGTKGDAVAPAQPRAQEGQRLLTSAATNRFVPTNPPLPRPRHFHSEGWINQVLPRSNVPGRLDFVWRDAQYYRYRILESADEGRSWQAVSTGYAPRVWRTNAFGLTNREFATSGAAVFWLTHPVSNAYRLYRREAWP